MATAGYIPKIVKRRSARLVVGIDEVNKISNLVSVQYIQGTISPGKFLVVYEEIEIIGEHNTL